MTSLEARPPSSVRSAIAGHDGLSPSRRADRNLTHVLREANPGVLHRGFQSAPRRTDPGTVRRRLHGLRQSLYAAERELANKAINQGLFVEMQELGSQPDRRSRSHGTRFCILVSHRATAVLLDFGARGAHDRRHSLGHHEQRLLRPPDEVGRIARLAYPGLRRRRHHFSDRRRTALRSPRHQRLSRSTWASAGFLPGELIGAARPSQKF